MTRGISRLAAVPLTLVGALLAGCVPMVVGTAVVGGAVVATDRRAGGSQVDDELIQGKAGGRIGEAFPDGRVQVNVTSYNRVVLLTGQVPNEADKAAVEKIVAKIDNVQSVVNELSIGPAATFGERTKDSYVTTKVKASIVDAQDLFANSIKITTHRGVVYLMGRVTEREANRAAEIARGVSGVVKVVKVFEIISEEELAHRQVKTAAKPASAPASAP
ncbi:MAG: BON domain-containing protein [Rhizobacter sp.]|nr:BON domain-containing protein [Rhizobacter sp.]